MSTQVASVQASVSNTSSNEASPELHGLWSIGLATFIGGALASGYLIHKNFSMVKRREDAKRSIALFAALGIVALFSAWNTPPDIVSFLLSIGLPQTTIVVLAAWNLQTTLFSIHRSTGGKFRSVWFALIPGAIANIAIKGLFYGISVAIAG